MEAAIKRWYRKVWMTRGARFNAHSRLERHGNLSNLTISLLTVYIIALNLFPLISYLKMSFNGNDTNFLTIILSILILSISQYIGSKEYKLKAAKFHDCGKELTKVYEELYFYNYDSTSVTFEDLKKISGQYQSIINKFDENHSKIDLLVFMRDNVGDFKNIKFPKLFCLKVNLLLFFKCEFLYWFFILSPPIILGLKFK